MERTVHCKKNRKCYSLNWRTLIYILLIAFIVDFILRQLITISMASTLSDSEAEGMDIFAANIFDIIRKGKPKQNVIISPVSIQTALVLTYLGAGGDTAKEIQTTLQLSSKKDEIGRLFSKLIKEHGKAELVIANRIFLNSTYTIRPEFNDAATKYLNSEAECLDFSQAAASTTKMNNWVKQQTNDKVNNLIEQGTVSKDTAAMLVNAIYFKGLWENPFSVGATQSLTFWTGATQSLEVDAMCDENKIPHANLPELKASAVELRYKNSNLSMMVILPNERVGLEALENQLKTFGVNGFGSKFSTQNVKLYLPRFRAEFGMKLNDVLRSLGIGLLFESEADLTGIINSGPSLKVSEIQHKAFIDVNEAGSEAAAATFVKATPMSLNVNTIEFKVDHPFVFVIKSPRFVYFVGHIVTI